MGYIHVENFSGGLDDRKSRLTSAAGTLSYLNNAHLTSGGEIEKRKAFVPVFIFPPNVQCLGGAGGATIWLFGNGSRPPGLPAEFTWLNVRRGSTNATKMLRVEFWGSEPRALFRYPDGNYWWAGTSLVDTSSTEIWNWEGLPANNVQDLLVLDQKLYTVQGSILEVSGVAEPEKHGEEHVGSALFDVSTYGPKANNLVALALYQNRLATFSKNGCVLWQVDPDEQLTRPLQFLPNFGIAAPRSIVNYGETDTFALSYSGVRSIRAKDSSNLATISDVGSPIDKTITAHLELLLESNNLAGAVGCYEPREGRYWLALYDVIYVLSFFPSARITAWSTYTPGFQVVDMFAMDNTLFVLSPDTLYSVGAYKGNADSDYDRTVVDVELPYLNGGDPAASKIWEAFDATVTGKWAAYAAFVTDEPGHDELTNIITKSTYDLMAHTLSGESSHIKLRLRSEFDGYALLSDLAVHFTTTETG